jgi:hypothetical protein
MAEQWCVVESCPGFRAESGSAWSGSLRGSRACAACLAQLGRVVARLPGLYRDCEDLLARRPRHGPAQRVRGPRPGGISLDDAIVAARSDIMLVTASWAGLVADHHPSVTRPERDVQVLSRFLLTHLTWLAGKPCVMEAAAELGQVTRAAEQALDRCTGDRRALGMCDRPGCNGTVYAGGGRAAHVGCDRGHRWKPSEWLLLSRRLGHRSDADKRMDAGRAVR